MESKLVLIQKGLLSDLKVKLKEHNDKLKSSNPRKEPKLKEDVAVRIVSLINSIPSEYRDDEEENNGIVFLNATKLKKACNDKYNLYINFLEANEFIKKVSEYSTERRQSTAYRINTDYAYDSLDGYTITDKTLLKRMAGNTDTKKVLENKLYCLYKRPHLVKYFTEDLTIDKDNAFSEVSVLKNNKETYFTYSNCVHHILNIYKNNFWCSIDPRTDNRLHTTMSLTNRIIRKHITYKEENIVGLDVKSSQMYFLCAILKATLMKEDGIPLLESIGATRILDEKVIFKLINLELDKQKIEKFVLSVLHGDIYESFSKELAIQENEGVPFRKLNKPKSKRKTSKTIKSNEDNFKIVKYKNKRHLAKMAIMEILNSSPKTTISEAIIFRNLYPEVTKIMDCIKGYGVKMWRLLNHVEAHCLLDVAAKRFAEKYPDIFLTSIHDCLITTEQNIGTLEKEVRDGLMEITTVRIPPRFEVETWREDKAL